MEFGIFTIPSSNLDFRKMDGVWTAVEPYVDGDSKKIWAYYTNVKGKPVDAEYVENHKQLQCRTYCRSVAKVLFGVPTEVELYTEDAKGIQNKDNKKKKVRNGR